MKTKEVQKYYLSPILNDEQVKERGGTYVQDTDVKHTFEEDSDVYCSVTGQCIAKLRNNVISKQKQRNAYKALVRMPDEFASDNRGMASGVKAEEAPDRTRNVKKDGTISKTVRVDRVKSGIMGYFDRNPRFPFCRETVFTRDHFERFRASYPLIKKVDEVYASEMPDEYKRQRDTANKTSQDFVIQDTSFTTITVNKNWQTAIHTDRGDFQGGFGNLVVLRTPGLEGGLFTIMRWGAAFNVQNGAVLLADVHQWHGNTPVKRTRIGSTRISLVMYYREHMIDCQSAEEELQRVKHRKLGDSLK